MQSFICGECLLLKTGNFWTRSKPSRLQRCDDLVDSRLFNIRCAENKGGVPVRNGIGDQPPVIVPTVIIL